MNAHPTGGPGEARVGRASAGVAVFVMAPGCGWGGVVGRGVGRPTGAIAKSDKGAWNFSELGPNQICQLTMVCGQTND